MSKLEIEPLQLIPFQIVPIQKPRAQNTNSQQSVQVLVPSAQLSFNISSTEYQYLNLLNSGLCIHQVVEHYLKNGWLVNFNELYNLIFKLHDYHLISNSNIKKYIEKYKPTQRTESKSFLDKISVIFNASEEKTLKEKVHFNFNKLLEMPFFRSIPVGMANFLYDHGQLLEVSENRMLCREGESTRDLFVIVKGEVGVYQHNKGESQLLATLSDSSVVGEGGFFLNQKRTASVITQTKCLVFRIVFDPAIDEWVNKDKASSLQIRFWFLHALTQSDFFKNLPPDVFDSFLNTGRTVSLRQGQTLFQQGELGSTFYVVIKGALSVYQNNKKINTMKQGKCFGEMALMLSQGVRTATVVADDDVLLIEVQKFEFYKLLSSNLFLAKEVESIAHMRMDRDIRRQAK